MESREVLLYADDPGRGSRVARLCLEAGIGAERAASFGAAARRVAAAAGPPILVAILEPLDASRTRVLSGLRKARPGVSILLGLARPEAEGGWSLLSRGIVDFVAAASDTAALASAARREREARRLREGGERRARDLRRLKAGAAGRLRRARELEEIQEATVENLLCALDLRDVETFGHSQTVAKYTEVLARLLGLDDPDRLGPIRRGALLHDIGKIAIPDAILKKPGPLTGAEWDKVRRHPELGFGLVREIRLEPAVGAILLGHHERFDGRGYPRRLAASEIPVEARIFALADALDAITAHRPYRPARDFAAARDEIVREAGAHFDPKVVEAFASLPPRRWERIRCETTSRLPAIGDFARLARESSG